MTINGYQIQQWSQRWVLIDGAWYREATATRLTDGATRIIAVLDES